MPGNKTYNPSRLSAIYNAYKADGMDKWGSEQKFINDFYAAGEQGYKNRKQLWSDMRQAGADVGNSYEEFSDLMMRNDDNSYYRRPSSGGQQKAAAKPAQSQAARPQQRAQSGSTPAPRQTAPSDSSGYMLMAQGSGGAQQGGSTETYSPGSGGRAVESAEPNRTAVAGARHFADKLGQDLPGTMLAAAPTYNPADILPMRQAAQQPQEQGEQWHAPQLAPERDWTKEPGLSLYNGKTIAEHGSARLEGTLDNQRRLDEYKRRLGELDDESLMAHYDRHRDNADDANQLTMDLVREELENRFGAAQATAADDYINDAVTSVIGAGRRNADLVAKGGEGDEWWRPLASTGGPGADIARTRRANEEMQPSKLAGRLQKSLADNITGILSGQLENIKQEAEYLGKDADAYLQETVIPRIMERAINSLYGRLQAQSVPKNDAEYIANSLMRSLPGLVLHSLIRTREQRQMDNTGMALAEEGAYGYKPSTAAKVTGGVLPLAIDSSMGLFKIGAGLANVGMRGVLGMGRYTAGEAAAALVRENSKNIIKRVTAGLGRNMIRGGSSFAVYGMISDAANQWSLNGIDEWDAGQTARHGVEEFATGAALGVGGSVGSGLLGRYGINGAEQGLRMKLVHGTQGALASGGRFVIESGTFTLANLAKDPSRFFDENGRVNGDAVMTQAIDDATFLVGMKLGHFGSRLFEVKGKGGKVSDVLSEPFMARMNQALKLDPEIYREIEENRVRISKVLAPVYELRQWDPKKTPEGYLLKVQKAYSNALEGLSWDARNALNTAIGCTLARRPRATEWEFAEDENGKLIAYEYGEGADGERILLRTSRHRDEAAANTWINAREKKRDIADIYDTVGRVNTALSLLNQLHALTGDRTLLTDFLEDIPEEDRAAYVERINNNPEGAEAQAFREWLSENHPVNAALRRVADEFGYETVKEMEDELRSGRLTSDVVARLGEELRAVEDELTSDPVVAEAEERREQAEAAYNEGYEVEEPAEMQVVNDEYAAAEREINDPELWAVISEDPERAMLTAMQSDLPQERKDAIYRAAEVCIRRRAMMERIGDQADRAAQEASDMVDRTSVDGEDGRAHVQVATLLETGEDGRPKQVFIVGGKVVMRRRGGGMEVDREKSDKSLWVKDDADGEPRQIDISEVGEVEDRDAEDVRAEAVSAAEERVIGAEGDKIDFGVNLEEGAETVFTDADGEHRLRVLKDNGDGTVQVEVDGQVMDAAKEQIGMMVRPERAAAEAAPEAGAETGAENGQDRLNGQTGPAGEAPRSGVAAAAGAGEAAEGGGVEDMPMKADGNPDFSQVSTERAVRYITEQLDETEAKEYIGVNVRAADAALAAHERKKPKMEANLASYKSKKGAWEADGAPLRAEAETWHAIEDTYTGRAAEAERLRAEEESRRQQEEAERKRYEEERRLAEKAAAERAAEEARNAEEERRRAAEEAAERRRRAEESRRRAAEARAKGEGAAGEQITEKWNNAERVEGVSDEIVLANGERIKGRYVLVESGAATPSHDSANEFAMSEGFPVDANGTTVNDRDYAGDREAQNITRQMAASYDSRAAQGTVPVVSRDGVVLSGNGRTMAGEIAARNGTDGAYVDYLKEFGGKFGFKASDVEKFKHPRVVFVPDEHMPYTIDTFAKFNAKEMKGQSRTEQAVKMGKMIDDSLFGRIMKLINGFESLKEFYADPKAAAEAIGELRDGGIISEMQYAEMFDGESLSPVGQDLLETALIGKAFNADPDAVRMLTEVKSLRRNVVTALRAIVDNVSMGNDFSLAEELSEAVKLAYRARMNGYKHGDAVSSYARQLTMFPIEEGETVADYKNATILMLADLVNEGRVTQLKKVLSNYNEEARDSAAGQVDMFSGGVRSKEEILSDIMNRFGYGPKGKIEKSNAKGGSAGEGGGARGQGAGGETGGIRQLAEEGGEAVEVIEPKAHAEAIGTAIRPMEEHFGVKMHVVSKLDDITNSKARAAIEADMARGTTSTKAWYAMDSGEVFIYAPHIEDAATAKKAYLHEVVAHRGLRALLGDEAFNELCDNVWYMMDARARAKFGNYRGVDSAEDEMARQRAAADEYMAAISEDGVNDSRWARLKAAVRRAMRPLLIHWGLAPKMNDADIRDLLRRSGEYLHKNRAEEERRARVEEASERIVDEPLRMKAELDEAPTLADKNAIITRTVDKLDGAAGGNTTPNSLRDELEEKRGEYVRAHRGDLNEDADVRFSIDTHANQFGLRYEKGEDGKSHFFEDLGVDEKGRPILGKEIKKFRPEHIRKSPVGAVLSRALQDGVISREQYDRTLQNQATIMDYMRQIPYLDEFFAVSGAIGYAQLPSGAKEVQRDYYRIDSGGTVAFVPYKSNSETQYDTTFDVTTICRKTQTMIDVMSQTMKQLKHGLTVAETIKIVYDNVYKVGQGRNKGGRDVMVPCNVCYVFNRWVNLGNLFDTMRRLRDQYQDMSVEEIRAEREKVMEDLCELYRVTGEDELFRSYREYLDARDAYAQMKPGTEEKKAAREVLTSFTKKDGKLKKSMEKRRRAIAAEVDKLNFKIFNYEHASDKSKASAPTEADYQRLSDLRRELAYLDKATWFDYVRLQDGYEPIPDDVLFDINKSYEFKEKYPGAWKYRTTRGSGMGKAAAAYSPEFFGSGIVGRAFGPDAARDMSKNFLLARERGADGRWHYKYIDEDTWELKPEAVVLLRKARDKAAAQNYNSGQRFQSTSDTRVEYLTDYNTYMLEQMLIGSKAQGFTKVPECAKLFGDTGSMFNMSLIARGKGYEDLTDEQYEALSAEDKRDCAKIDGVWRHALYSDVSGVNHGDAFTLNDAYPNLQPIMVGLNSIHLRLCMELASRGRITFNIPYHSSGDTPENFRSKSNTVGEDIAPEQNEDYTKVETDQIKDPKNEAQATARSVFAKIKTGAELGEEEMAYLRGLDPENVVRQLYMRFRGEDVDGGPAKILNKYLLPEDRDTAGKGYGSSDRQCRIEAWDEKTGETLTDEDGNPVTKQIVMSAGQGELLMPNDYWDKTIRLEDADRNGDAFLELCEQLGYYPRFSGWYRPTPKAKFKHDAKKDFTGERGYWSTLIDISMYDLDGNPYFQQAVDASRIGTEHFDREEMKKLGGRTLTPMEENPGPDSDVIRDIVNKSVADINAQRERDKAQLVGVVKKWVKNGRKGLLFSGKRQNSVASWVRSEWETNPEFVQEIGRLAKLTPKELEEATRMRAEDDGNIRLMSTEEREDVFVSNARRAVEGIRQEKASPQQWLAMIQKAGGLKAAEDKWMGLSDWLKEQKAKSLSKEEVLQYIRENQVRVEEVDYGDSNDFEDSPKLRELRNEFDELVTEAEETTGSGAPTDWAWWTSADWAWWALDKMVERYGKEFDNAFEIQRDGSSFRLAPRRDMFGDIVDEARKFLGAENGVKKIHQTRMNYTTDGLTNKREIALTVPSIEPWNENDRIHFGDAGGGRAVAWIRFGDAVDADGNRVLVIDEIQSKRHQAGRERGYRTPDSPVEKRFAALRAMNDYQQRMEEKYGPFYLTDDMTAEEQHEYQRLYEEMKEAMEADRETDKSYDVPDAPFEKNWHELALKRMLRYAAENGYDKVAWTKGAQQASRYGLGGVVDGIAIKKSSRAEGKYQITTFDKNDIPINSGSGQFTREEVLRTFGKDLGGRMLDGVENLEGYEDTYLVDGDGLEIGGEGMKGFYDRMLPQWMDKYGKKWGVKTGEVELAGVRDKDLAAAGGKMWSVDVTDAMKESVKEGQVMFMSDGVDDGRTEEIMERAKKKFGLTDDVREAGYVLPDGGMLDFSGRNELDAGADDSFLRGSRQEDHRRINSIAYDYDADGNEVRTGVETDMRDFIRRGGIRIDAGGNVGIINLAVKPTEKQRAALRRLINLKGGNVDVDFGDGWNSDHYVEYDGAKAQRVLGDIDRYFDEGIKPEGNVRFMSGEDGEAEESEVRDGDGLLGDVPGGDELASEAELEAHETRVPLDEALVNGLMQLARDNKDNVELRVRAMRSIGGSLGKLRQAMARQREYDRGTVDKIVRIAKTMLGSGIYKQLGNYQVRRLLGMVNAAAGREDITKQAQGVVDILTAAQERAYKETMAKLLKVKGSKLDQRGVEVQAGLDIAGQRRMAALKKGMAAARVSQGERTTAAGEETPWGELLSDIEERLGSDDPVVSDAAGDEYVGVMLAQQWYNDIRKLEEDDRAAVKMRKEAEADVAEGRMTREAYREFAKALEEERRNRRMQRLQAYEDFLGAVSGQVKAGAERAAAFREAAKERVKAIRADAGADLADVPYDEHVHQVEKRGLRHDAVRLLLKPLATFDNLLRYFGKNTAVGGRGRLFRRFMEDGFVKTTDNEWRGVSEACKELDEKASEVMGKKMHWSGLFDEVRRQDKKGGGIDLEIEKTFSRQAGDTKVVHLTPGQMLYVYMVNKMADGRMKLRKMGISEQTVELIKDRLDPRFVQLADWLQDEYLVKKREKYNEVYERMFGAPMAAIENYFPLKVNQLSRHGNEDVEREQADGLMSTATGSVIKRRVNSLPLDISADAFDVVLEHIQQMEHWAAYAELNRDLNTLLSDRRFKAQVQNMKSARYGSGKDIWDEFRRTCQMVAGTYRGSAKNTADRLAVNVSKGVTGAKIAFRVFTALKQTLSYPAYFTEASASELAKSTANLKGSVKWALENLPMFARRWESRQAGDTRLQETPDDWSVWNEKFASWVMRNGMWMNAAVDMCTVAAGAKAIYETKKARYLMDGYSEEKAHEKALNDAAISYNETQQSSEAAFVSTMQVDRTLFSTMLTVFRNSPMAYTRRVANAVAELRRLSSSSYREQLRDRMAGMMQEEGLTEAQAQRAAKREVQRAAVKNMAEISCFGLLLQAAWNMGPYMAYMLLGKDDDEKKAMVRDALLHSVAGSVEGLAFGNVWSDLFELGAVKGESAKDYEFNLLPLQSDARNAMKLWDYDMVRGVNDLFNLVWQAKAGANPQTLTDVAVALYDACKGDLGLAREAAIFGLRFINAPQSAIDKVYLDEIGMLGKDAKKLDYETLCKRYANYRLYRQAPLTGILYGDAKGDALERSEKRFERMAAERYAMKDAEELARIFDESGDDYTLKGILGDALSDKAVKEIDPDAKGKDAFRKDASNLKEEGKAAREMYRRLRTAEDVTEDARMAYYVQQARNKGGELKKEVDAEKRAIDQFRRDIVRAPYELADGTVETRESLLAQLRQHRRELIDAIRAELK